MKIIFIYRATETGAVFGLPLEFDGHRPFNSICADAHEIACEVSGQGVEFVICQHPNKPRVDAFQSVGDVTGDILARAMTVQAKMA